MLLQGNSKPEAHTLSAYNVSNDKSANMHIIRLQRGACKHPLGWLRGRAEGMTIHSVLYQSATHLCQMTSPSSLIPVSEWLACQEKCLHSGTTLLFLGLFYKNFAKDFSSESNLSRLHKTHACRGGNVHKFRNVTSRWFLFFLFVF